MLRDCGSVWLVESLPQTGNQSHDRACDYFFYPQRNSAKMSINEMKVGEVLEIAQLLSGSASKPHPFIGQYVIARCYTAGVHAGVVESVDGENVILTDSRRLWQWKAQGGIALSGVAQCGLQSGKVDVVNPRIYLTGVCELIPCSTKSEESIRGAK